ncbi:MAG: hypothetical protein R3F37_20360 [Candidatus Competibacteraceae bacterium]
MWSTVTLRYGTAYYGLGLSERYFETALRALAESTTTSHGAHCRGGSGWIRIRSVLGWIGLPGIAERSCYRCGATCLSPSVNGISWGAYPY